MANRQRLNFHIPKNQRTLFKATLLLLFTLVFAAALSVPFYFESMTLWYKTGADRTMLRTGQLAGMSALVFFLLQIMLAVQGQFLEELFAKRTLSRWHKVNGIFVLLLALCHLVLVLAPEGMANLPIGKKYWPEMIGGVLFLLLLILIVSSYFRDQLNISFKNWRTLHRPIGYLALVLLLVHVVFVSDSFENTQLRALLVTIFGGMTLWVVVIKILQWFDQQ